MIAVRDTPIVRDSYRTKMPYLIFRRIDLTPVRRCYEYGYQVDRGGDYLLKRVTARWSEYWTTENGDNFAGITLSLRKSSSTFGYFDEISPKLYSSPCDSMDSVPVAAGAAVDNDIFSINFSGTQRFNAKKFNWLVEDNASLIFTVVKDDPTLTYPEYIDIMAEGYYINIPT